MVKLYTEDSYTVRCRETEVDYYDFYSGISFPSPKQLSIKALKGTQNLQNIMAVNKNVAFRTVKIAAAERFVLSINLIPVCWEWIKIVFIVHFNVKVFKVISVKNLTFVVCFVLLSGLVCIYCSYRLLKCTDINTVNYVNMREFW